MFYNANQNTWGAWSSIKMLWVKVCYLVQNWHINVEQYDRWTTSGTIFKISIIFIFYAMLNEVIFFD
jgi:hypothetical protein